MKVVARAAILLPPKIYMLTGLRAWCRAVSSGRFFGRESFPAGGMVGKHLPVGILHVPRAERGFWDGGRVMLDRSSNTVIRGGTSNRVVFSLVRCMSPRSDGSDTCCGYP